MSLASLLRSQPARMVGGMVSLRGTGHQDFGAGAAAEEIFGTWGPALPTIAGLTWAWDFDFAREPLGAMRAEIATRTGSEADAFLCPMSGGLSVVPAPAGGTRRALRFTAGAATVAAIRNGFTVLDEANADFTVVIVAHRRAAGAAHTLWHLHAGHPSGQDSEIVNTHRLQVTSGNAVQYLRNAASGETTAGLGTFTTGQMIVVTRSNLASDNIGRGMLNGGAKASTATRNITQAEFSYFLLGGQMIWRSGTSGYYEFLKHGDVDIERIALAAGAAADADLDTLNAWAVAGYPA
jgi:hypothetical protein